MSFPPVGDPLSLADPALGGRVDESDDRAEPVDERAPAWRKSLGWSATSAPVALLLVGGIAFGPWGTNILSRATLLMLEPIVPVALAALGVLVGLGVGHGRTGDRRLFAAASLDACLTTFIVASGVAVAVLATLSSRVRPVWTLVLASGVCAATSLTLPAGDPAGPRTMAFRIRELGALLPIVIGGLLLAWLRAGSAWGAIALLAQTAALTLALSVAGWLLLTRAASETEERVFALSVLLLVGGVAEALAQSALLVGLVAGVFWRYAGAPTDTIGRDVRFVQHPFLLLVLLVAGANVEFSPLAVGLGVSYVALRVFGKWVGANLAERVAGAHPPRHLERHLLPAGIFGVAFALNLVSVADRDTSLLLAVVVIGTIGSELVALLPAGKVDE